MLFTTSWDDGYKLDLRLADLLDQYGIKGTFYVCPRKQHDKDMLTSSEIATLAEKHEIGAHTLRHSMLTEVSVAEAKEEIEQSKAWVEQITGIPCKMFCYPYGDWNTEIASMVEASGFIGARTTNILQFAAKMPYGIPTTLQVSPFPKRHTWSRWWHPLDPYGPLRVKRSTLNAIGINKQDRKDWLSLAKALFQKASEDQQSIFHLWGHSHEVEKYNMWEELEKFLAHVQQSGVTCMINSQVIEQHKSP